MIFPSPKKFIVVLIVLAAGLVLAFGLHAWSTPSQKSGSTQPKITWFEKQIEIILSPGETASKNLTFTSTLGLQNIVIEAVPEIAGFITIQPNTFANVSANQPQQVSINFSISSGTTLGTFEGTIHVRTGSQTLPATLKAVVNVWPTFRDKTLGFKITYPPRFTASMPPQGNVLQIAVSARDSEFAGAWVYTHQNASALTPRDWWLQSRDHGIVPETITDIVVAGLPAARIDLSGELRETHIIIVAGSKTYDLVSIALSEETLQVLLKGFRPI